MKCNFLSFWKIAKYLSFSFLHWISDVFFCNIKIKTYNSLKIIIFHALYLLSIKPVENNCLGRGKKIESVKNGENFDLCAPGSCPVISNYSKYYLNTWRTMENECSEGKCEHNAKYLHCMKMMLIFPLIQVIKVFCVIQ